MSSLFVKLNGVGAINVTRQAARPFCPCRRHSRRALAIHSYGLPSVVRAGTAVLAHRGGVGLFSLHVCSFAATGKLINSANSGAR